MSPGVTGATMPAVRDDELLSQGQRARGTVVGIRRLSPAEPDVVEFELTVELSDRSYDVRHRQAMSRLALSDLRLGVTVPLMVDVDDPHRLIIV